ncbi:MAG: aromatic amino acid ammonia-lyase [Bacteroidales bacterium]|jgi:histidine ammonia-lyase|nr:aromatic amino acid ammonia-lyase [Bacteroidales bacterium]
MSVIVDELTINLYKKILINQEKIEISDTARKRVEESYQFLKNFCEEKLIYGINTGFGPMAQYRVDDEMREKLQYNFVRSHATGTGQPLSPIFARSLMIARLSTILRGYSGVHPEVPELIAGFLNTGITPQIFEHGSVGASGDLVQLDHLTLNLISEGEVFFQGEKMLATKALELTGLSPIKMHIREALALANGTSCMTGIGIVNLLNAKKLLNHAILASVWINEITAAFDDHFSKELNEVKKHNGQRIVAQRMREIAEDSKRFHNRSDYFYKQKITDNYLKIKVQEYYSLRCVPQVLGPVWDTLDYTEKILTDEINSVSDNPIIDAESQNVFHGGNFHGDYVAMEMDKLKIALTKMTMLMERQSNYLCHDKLNGILPPFVNLGVKGLNYGMQAAHFTATSTTAECQTLSNPMSVHSIPCNNDNQDVVSMGTNAALITAHVVENAFQVMAIHYMILAQAVDCLKITGDLSSKTKEAYRQVRKIFPAFAEDHAMSGEIEAVTEMLKAGGNEQ